MSTSPSKIGQLHYLANLFGEIFVPQAVYDEVTISGKERSGVTEIVDADWLVVREVEDRSRVGYLLTQLDMGEAEALVLAQEIQADLVLVDERKARAVAHRLGLEVIGTAGLFLLLKDLGIIAEIRPLLDRLRSLDFRLSDRIFAQVLSQAGE